MPVFAVIFMIVTLSSIGLPALNGFVGEFMILLGAFESELRWFAVVATTGVVLSAVYMLWMYQRVMFGKLDNPKNQNLKDLSVREICIMLPLLVFIFWIGVYPNTFLEKMEPAVNQALSQISGEARAQTYIPVCTDAEQQGKCPHTYGVDAQGDADLHL
jgi:NADH-quinone oxidoreductase subunit M